MSNPRDIAEPSMEEILSSIRRIIAADDGDGARPAPPAASGVPGLRREPARAEPEPAADAAPASTPAPDDAGLSTAALEDEDSAEDAEPDDVLELTTLVEDAAATDTEPPSPVTAPADATTSMSAEVLSSEPAPTGAESGFRRQPPTPHEKETQPVSTATAAANGKTEEIMSGGTAAATADAFGKLSQSLRPPAENRGPITGDQRRLEDIVVEALRPMLKSWLDEHLPAIVDRLVQQEISKMARRAELM